jgi:2-C-methyl-D-erythritol 4-phosphate cytidylyltransferase
MKLSVQNSGKVAKADIEVDAMTVSTRTNNTETSPVGEFPMYSVIIPAAGTGSRMGLGYNKLFYKIVGCTIIEHTVSKFFNDARCKQIILVSSADDLEKMKEIFDCQPRVSLVVGGATRQESIYHALDSVTEDIVLVHDGARPFVTVDIINACYDAAVEGFGAIASVVSKDTIKKRDSQRKDVVNQTIPRDELVIVQTPQAFPTHMLKKANELAINAEYSGTDDASLVEKFTEIEVKIVKGCYKNIKFTTPEDIEYFEFLMKVGNA